MLTGNSRHYGGRHKLILLFAVRDDEFIVTL